MTAFDSTTSTTSGQPHSNNLLPFDTSEPMDSARTFLGGGCDPKDPAHQKLWQHHVDDLGPSVTTPSAMKQSAPKPGRDALAGAVEIVEAEAASLSDESLDRAVAPDEVVAAVAAKIAAAIRSADPELARAPVAPVTLTPLVQRLDVAIGTLYVVARRHRIPMRETHLEEVFDLEDKLRTDYTAYGPTNRADAYYASNFVPITHTTTPAPDASALATDLEAGGGGMLLPRNRDELVQRILGFATHLGGAISVGFGAARDVITEPSKPKDPSIIEDLITAAVNVVAGCANAAIGNLIGAGLKLVRARTGVEEHLGRDLTEVLHTGFNAAGKDNAKLAGKALVRETKANGHDPDPSGLSPKTLYLQAAQKETTVRVNQIGDGFIQYAGTLKRVPIDTLLALSERLNAAAADALARDIETAVVNEWVNFGKAAAERAVEMRDPEHRPASPSKLDNFLDPYGVVRIHVRIDDQGKPQLERADLPGVSDAVLKFIQKELASLGTLAIHRHVEIVPRSANQLPLGGFDLDRTGNVTFDPRTQNDGARLAWARLGGRHATHVVSDSDVLAGKDAMIAWLGTLSCRNIEVAKE